MLDKKSSGDGLTSRDGSGSLSVDDGHNGRKALHKQPTLEELREALLVFGAASKNQSASSDGFLLCGAKTEPRPVDFSKPLKDLEVEAIEALGQPSGRLFSKEQLTRIGKITADEIKSIKDDKDKVSKLSPLMIKALPSAALLGFIDDKDKPNRFIDLLDKKQAQALLSRLDQDGTFSLFLKDQGAKVKADVAKVVEGLKEIAPEVKGGPGRPAPTKPIGGDPLAPKQKPKELPEREPIFTEDEKTKLSDLLKGLKDGLAKDTFKDWCGPKGEKLSELAALVDRPGGGAAVKEREALIASIKPDQIKQLEPAQLAGLTAPIIARMDPRTIIALKDEQIAVLTAAQHREIWKRLLAAGDDSIKEHPDYAHFKSKMNDRAKEILAQMKKEKEEADAKRKK